MLNLLVQAVRSLLGLIDEAVYSVISSVYKLMIEIASQQVFQSETIQAFGERVYALVGIFMLFKLAFSLIRYIVNPDEMKDSKRGGKKLIVNVMVVVVLITITPTIFEQSRNLQRVILQENVIGNLILGISGENNNVANQAAKDWQLVGGHVNPIDATEEKNDETQEEKTEENNLNKTVGDQIATLTFNAFYFPAHGDCSEEIKNTKEMNIDVTNESEIEIAEITETCSTSFSGETVASSYVKGMAFNDISTVLFENDVINDQVTIDGNKKFSMKYMVLISTIAGIVLLLIFINFCIEVAVRTIKLGFLELMAPIPIISYIDPKSAESGLFSKWLKMCVTTYLSLFIRLAAIYFAIFAIGEITSGGINLTSSPLVTVFLILGALIFANQLPKMIEELVPSLKGSGTFSLNPMKTIGQSALATAAVAAPAAALGSMAANTYSAYRNAERGVDGRITHPGATFKKAIASGAGGALAGGVGGLRAGMASGGKGTPLGVAEKTITRNSNLRNYNDSQGGFRAGITSRTMDKVTTVAGLKYSSGSTSAVKNQIQLKQNQLQNLQENEQTNKRAVQDAITQQNIKVQAGLRQHFDYSATYDEKGNYTFDSKTYEGYAHDKVKDYLINEKKLYTEQTWNNLSLDEQMKQYEFAAYEGAIVDKTTYNAIHSSYEMATQNDLDAVKLKKEISSLEEQKNITFKDQK